jgi:antagonist of KipI
VVLGPQSAVFDAGGSQDGLRRFLSETYAITRAADRMGYRLAGPAVERARLGELLSEGTSPGAVQVPPDGQPIVLMADRPTTGGYPKIATLAGVGLPLLAQVTPGAGQVRFTPVSAAEAQSLLRAMYAMLEQGMVDDED